MPFREAERQLVAHEGLRLRPQEDAAGRVRIGVGYDVTARGWRTLEHIIGRSVDQADPQVTVDEALAVLENDLAATLGAWLVRYRWFEYLDAVRQRVLLDIGLRFGIDRCSERVRLIDAVRLGAWETAAQELVRIEWGIHERARARTLAHMMRTGVDPSFPVVPGA